MENKKQISESTKQTLERLIKESLRDWFKKEKWVRINSSGEIAGPCGKNKKQKNPARCLPKAKAQSLTKAQRKATAAKKKKAGKKGKQFVSNTKKAKVKREQVIHTIQEVLAEKKKKKKDRCHKRADQAYGTKTSAYKSGAIVRCRQGKIWKKKANENTEEQTIDIKLLDKKINGLLVVLAKYGDRVVGALRLKPYQGAHQVDSVKVVPDYRRMGIGTEMYRVANNALGAIYSDQSQSPAAKMMWDKLVSNGEAETANGLYIMREGPHDPVRPGILKRQIKGKITCTKARALKSKQKNKGNNTAKAAQRFINYHCD